MNREAGARYRARNREKINEQARDRWRAFRALRGDPCDGHRCDGCRSCAILAHCCRGDNPNHTLPEIGSITPYSGTLGVVREDASAIECHVCGEWFRRLTQHIWHRHDLTSEEYRSAFGLARGQPLIARSERIAMSESLIPWMGARAEVMDMIRPTPERAALLSARPQRLQVRASMRPGREERMRAIHARMKDHPMPRSHNEATCRVCGESYSVPPSAVRRGRKTCGSESCVAEWRRRHRGRVPTNAKLNASAVSDIRYRLELGESYRALANDFGVSSGAIGMIAHGVTWKARGHLR